MAEPEEQTTEARRTDPPAREAREPEAREPIEARDWPAYLAEFIGTFLLVLFICVIVSVNSRDGLGVTDFAVIGLVHAFLLAMLVYTLGGTSGAHLNPAVTIGLAAVRRFPTAEIGP